MKKALTVLLVAVMVIVCLTGCTRKAANSVKTDLLLGLPSGDAVTPMSLVDNFKAAHPEINITTDESSWYDFENKLKLQFASKEDVVPVFVTDSMSASSFGATGALEDVKSKADADFDPKLYTKALYSVTDREGHLWGVPHAINSIAMVYNKDLFDKYGVAYPAEDWTFEDMFNMAKKLTVDEDRDGKTDVYGIYYPNGITQGWGPFMAAVGADPFGKNLDKSNLLDPAIKTAFEYYRKPFDEGWAPDAAYIATYGSAEVAFAAGKIALFICQASNMTTINTNAPEGFRYDAQIMPVGWNGKRTCIYVPNVWVIYSGAPDNVKDAAWEWVKYYMSEEGQMIVAKEGPAGYPIMKSALYTVSSNGVPPEHKDAFYRGIDAYGQTILENPVSIQVNTLANELTNKVVNKNGELPDLLKEYDKLIQDEFDFYYNN